MADIQPGDVVVDPMCGGGSIGIEVCKVVCVCVCVCVFCVYLHVSVCMHV